VERDEEVGKRHDKIEKLHISPMLRKQQQEMMDEEMLTSSSSVGKLTFPEKENVIIPEDMLSFFKFNSEFNYSRRNADFFKLSKETGVI
jgi:hypothetical protein